MSELRRWSEEGATAGEVALLEASRRERPSAQARTRTLRALGVAAAVTTIGATTPTAAAAKVGMTFLNKIVTLSLVGALGGGAVVGGLAVHASRRKTPASSTASSVMAARRLSNVPARGQVTISPSPSPPSSPAPTPDVRLDAPDRPLHPASSSETLSREVRALEFPHRALADHDARLALDLLDRYRVQFPHGALSSEATLLRVQALVQSGDRAGAQALVDAYVIAHPDSPYARRLKEIVHGE